MLDSALKPGQDPTPALPAGRERALTVSVVICSFTLDRSDLLGRAARSVGRQTRPADEIIVVTDHAPALQAWARSALPGVTVVASARPRGLSGARNTGIEASSADVIAFLDDDAVADPDWLERLMPLYESPEVQGAGGLVVPAWQASRPPWMPEEFDWVVGCSYRGLPRRRSAVRNLIGCNMSFRRPALVAAGGFADGLGRQGENRLGCEETDLCIRLRAADERTVILYEPAARVSHWVPVDRSRLSYFVSRCHAEGRSKAEVARRVGTDSALASERAYARRVLPLGIRAGLADSIRGDRAGLARAITIALGLTSTVAGFLAGSLARAVAR